MKATLKLSFPHYRLNATSHEEAAQKMYRVEQITNSVHFDPGELISKAQVFDVITIGMFDTAIVPHKEK